MAWSSSESPSRTEPGRLARHQPHGLGRGVDVLGAQNPFQVPGEARRRDQLEVEALAAGQDGDRDFVNLGRGEHEHHVRRRLFQGLQQRVERVCRQHVHLVDDEDLAARPSGQVAHPFQHRFGLLDLGVGGGVDLDDVDRTAAGNLLAEVADATGLGGGALLAGERLGQDARRAGLPYPARPREQEGVVDAVLGDGVGQRPRDVLLTDQLREALRPVFPREDEIRHPWQSTRNAFLVEGSSVLTVRGEMRLDKLTIKAQEAVQAAHELAGSRGHQELTPEHLLAALLDQKDGITGALLRKLGSDPAMHPRNGDSRPGRSTAGARLVRRHLRRKAAGRPPRRGDAAVQGIQRRIRLQRAPAAGARGEELRRGFRGAEGRRRPARCPS